MVRRMTRPAEMEKRIARGARIAVEQHCLLAAGAGPTTIDPMLTAVAKTRIIGKGPVRSRRFAVVLA